VKSSPRLSTKISSLRSLRARIAVLTIVAFGALALFGASSATAAADPTTGTISGTVTDAGAGLMSGVPVSISGMGASSYSNFMLTPPNGVYTFSDLPLGYYQISFQGDNLAPSVRQTPAPITVDLTSATSNNDVVFPRWATGTSTVSGNITRAGEALSGVIVQLIAFPNYQEYQTEQATTDANGHYEIDHLPPFDYTLQLQFAQSLGSYDFNGPDINITTNGQTVTRDQDITPWPAATSAVSGSVVDSGTGNPIANSDVELDSSDNGASYSFTTDADGTFSFPGVVPGSYNLSITGPSIASIPTFVPFFTSLGVFPYQTDPLGPLGLHPANATITGTVTDASAHPLDGIFVDAQLTTDSNVGVDLPTDSNGVYSLSGLEAGTYTVSAGGNNMITQFATVTVAAGATAMSNFSLADSADGGSISGTVRDANGNPLQGICEFAYDSAGNIVANGSSAGTDPNGAYTVGGLGVGQFTVYFYDCNSLLTHASTYLGNVYTLAGSQMVPLSQGENSTGSANDVTMRVGGTIGGHVDVSAPGGDVPFPDGSLVVPTVQQQVGTSWVDWLNNTAFAGNGASDYQVNGLPPGHYRLKFEDTNEGVRTYETQWWSSTNSAGISTPDASSVISLAAGQVVTDKDAHMQIPVPTTDPTAPADTTTNGDNISAPDQVTQGQNVTVNVGSDLAGDWVSVWGHSSPVLLGTWAQVSASGTVTVPVPTSLPAGSHNLIAQTSDGTLLGSVPLSITAVPTSLALPPHPSSPLRPQPRRPPPRPQQRRRRLRRSSTRPRRSPRSCRPDRASRSGYSS
jgi:hypothetical protein